MKAALRMAAGCRPLRRALSPLLVALEVALLVVFAAGVVAGALAAPFSRYRRLLRASAFMVTYMVMELAVVAACAALWLASPLPRWHARASRWEDRHFRLVGWALRLVLDAAGRFLHFRAVVEAGHGDLGDDVPLIVLARHGGPGDSFTIADLLLRQGRRVRVVLKAALQADPALDVALNRVGACFLAAPRAEAAGGAERVAEGRAARVAAAAALLGPGDALLLFPEGGNWTPARRLRVIRHLRSSGKWRQARAAQAMEHVLPARPGGVRAALSACPAADVVVLAHTGLDQVVTASQAWRSVPLEVPMTLRWWRTPATALPQDGDGRERWLAQEWAVVDEWIDARQGRRQPV